MSEQERELKRINHMRKMKKKCKWKQYSHVTECDYFNGYTYDAQKYREGKVGECK